MWVDRAGLPSRLVLALAATLLVACPATPPSGVRAGGRTAVAPTGGKATPRPTDPATAPPTGAPLRPGGPTGPTGTPQAGGATPAAGGPPPALAAVALAGVVRLPARLVSDHGGGVLSNNGAGFISDQGGGLIANNGGSVVANNGGGVVANNGGGYRLAQAGGDAPLAGTEVGLFDAAGAVVRDAEGRALVTRTDAEGRYRLPAAPSGENLVLRAAVGNGFGLASAIVPKGTGAGPRTVDVDLASTLVTGYILERYVKGQAAPRETLARLPADVEAETRKLALEALAAAPPALADFQPASLAAAGDALRKALASFDRQMDEVRKLLIPAGQLALGDGEPANRVAMGLVRGLAAAPDGTPWILVPEQKRLWRVDAEGRLRSLLDEAALGGATPEAMAPDGQGGVAVAAGPRVLHVDGQGRVTTLWDALPRRAVLMPGPPGKVWALVTGAVTTRQTAAELAALRAEALSGEVGAQPYTPVITGVTAPAALWELAPGLAPKRLRELPQALTKELDGVVAPAGRDAAGNLVLLVDGAGLSEAGESYRMFPGGLPMRYAYRLDPQAEAPQLAPASTTFGDVTVDATGTVYEFDGGAIEARTGADAAAESVPAGPDAYIHGADWVAHRLGAGAFLVALNDGAGTVLKGTNGQAAAIVGGEAPAANADPNVIDLRDVGGLAVMPDGALAVLRALDRQVLRVGTDRKLSVKHEFTKEHPFAANVIGFQTPADRIPRFGLLRVGPDGQALMREVGPEAISMQYLAAPQADGTIAEVVQSYGLVDFAWEGVGRLLLAEQDMSGDFVLSRATPAEGQDGEQLAELPARPTALALAPDGTAWLTGQSQLWRWKAGAEAVTAVSKPAGFPAPPAGGLVVDAKGRLVAADPAGKRVVRLDPATGAVTTLAGKGGRLYTGTGVADGLAGPGYLAFGAGGDLYVADVPNRQIKRVPASLLGD